MSDNTQPFMPAARGWRAVLAAARRHRVLAALLGAYVALSAVELVRVLLFDGPRTHDASFHSRETLQLPEGQRDFAWTRGIGGELLRPLYAPVVRVPLYLPRPDVPAGGLRVWLSTGNHIFDEVMLDAGRWQRFDYYLPPILGRNPWRSEADRMSLTGVAQLQPLAGEDPFQQARWILQPKPDYVRVLTDWGAPPGPPSEWVRVQVQSSFKPAGIGDESAMTPEERRRVDRRDLGVGVGELLWASALPAEGIGFWGPESDGEREFRWSRGRASLGVPAAARPVAAAGSPLELLVQLRSAAPDAADKPVEVTFYWEETVIGSVALRDQDWRSVRLAHPRLDGTPGVLTLSVNRIWNARRDAAGADTRDLGVAIVAPYWQS